MDLETNRDVTPELFAKASERFCGFSLERREEWKPKRWRCRVIPNKAERQDWRLTVFHETAGGALQAMIDEMAKVDQQNAS